MSDENHENIFFDNQNANTSSTSFYHDSESNLAIFEDASYDDENRLNESSESLKLIPEPTFTS
ncbi:8532_t:CDS:2 [Funneliformis mosseae]|uniref:8532_t:CDS:1 n=1 Tax=Funneliformis mosseae TaxID=27381 RepID=A0A9N9EBK6_FUNMO|nr:8532_t:CDS:2 [Funneliformis mosseae]